MDEAVDRAAGVLERRGLEPRGAWSRLTGGELSDVLGVGLADGRQVAVKVYPPRWVWKQDKEIHVYGRVRDVEGVTTPEVVAAEPAGTHGDTAVTVMTRIAGVPLSGAVGSFTRAQVGDVYRSIGRCLRALHDAVPEPTYGYVLTSTLDPVPDNESHVRRLFAPKLTQLRAHDGDDALARRVERQVDACLPALRGCTSAALCHNDLHEGNVMVRRTAGGWRMEGVVDVENAVAADPLLDLAKTEYYAVRGDPDRLAGLRDGYGPLAEDEQARVALYRLHHALELYLWFAAEGRGSALPSIRADLEAMAP